MVQNNESNGLGLGSYRPLIERKSIGQHVFEYLKQAIIRGNISPGERLVETHIAGSMGVSRTPVREAMHKLEREGLIRKQMRGGYAVLGMTREEVEETLGIRSVLEGYAAKMAAVKHKEEELEPLEKKIDEYGVYLKRGQLEALPKINSEFHDLLYELSKSRQLVKMINNLRDQVYRLRMIILKDKKMARESHDDHNRMIEYIRDRNGEGAEQVARLHILKVQPIILKEFERQDNH